MTILWTFYQHIYGKIIQTFVVANYIATFNTKREKVFKFCTDKGGKHETVPPFSEHKYSLGAITRKISFD